jgi:secreted trypsin-like serine protease
MPKRLLTAFSAAALVALAAPAAHAITAGGELDGNGHPYVGLMVAKDAQGKPLWRCSGTLLAPKLFLTAGHCTEPPAARAELWFDADMQTNAAAKGYPTHGQASGTTYLHPQFDPNAFYLYDLGVVVLDEPLSMSTYGALPTVDVLDSLATARGLKNVMFTAVGYGLQQINPVFVEQLKIRMFAEPNLIQINTGFTGTGSLLLSNNHATGGTCFGDSGGPNFIGSSNVVGGVTSFGINGNCAGTGGVYRVDRADDLNWIHSAFGSLLN